MAKGLKAVLIAVADSRQAVILLDVRLPSVVGCLFFVLGGMGVLASDGAEPVEKLVFVSCHQHARKAPALKTIADWKPDVFIWMGDNIYGDSQDMAVLRKKYGLVLANTDYAKIREEGTVLGTWDDHDYGANDVGKEFAPKAESQQEFLDFLGVAKDSPRRSRAGVYSRQDLGPAGQMVRVILLDTRYHRDELGSNGAILGEEQWQWLEESLRESPAQVNLLVSSIQILPSQHRFEKWSNFAKERARLLALLAEEEVPPVVLLTGDRHLGEISLDETSCGYPLYEITSSSLNHSFGGNPREVNRLRLGKNYGRNNFGSLTICWKGGFPRVSAVISDENGESWRKVAFLLSRTE